MEAKVPSKQDILMDSLITFYNINDNISELLKILNNSSGVSLRIIDWFVTNYSKKNDIHIIYDNNRFIVHKDYKDQLKAYTKKQFDPFCRRDRLQFYYKSDDYIRTTVGQLNFFRWALMNGIIQYIVTNHDEIEKDMVTCIRYNYQKLNKKEKQRRRELSKSASKSMNKYSVNVTVNFD